MARQRKGRSAFTLTELVVVLVLIGLIAMVLGPSLRIPRATMQSDVCLSNLHELGAAMQMYAAEDPAEQIIPVHMNMVQTCDYWLWRTVNWFAWGGQSATESFRIAPDIGYWLSGSGEPPMPGPTRVEYDETRRPLYSYFAGGEEEDFEAFHCPMDAGYPAAPQIDSSPMANANRPCWDTIGNSYRANLLMFTFSGGGVSPSSGHFSMGPWGHRLSTLPTPGQLVLAADPLFYEQLGWYEDVPDEVAYGWHDRWFEENVLYCDGSARATSSLGLYPVYPDKPPLRPVTKASKYAEWPPVLPWGTDLVWATPAFQLDCYPVPGAIIWGDWSSLVSSEYWPGHDAFDEFGDP